MLRTRISIPFDPDIILTAIKKQEYEKAKAIIHIYIHDTNSSDIINYNRVLLDIVNYLQAKQRDASFIIETLKKIEISNRIYSYKNVINVLLPYLFSTNAFNDILKITENFIDLLSSDIESLDQLNQTMIDVFHILSRVYTAQGQAYHKTNQKVLALHSIRAGSELISKLPPGSKISETLKCEEKKSAQISTSTLINSIISAIDDAFRNDEYDIVIQLSRINIPLLLTQPHCAFISKAYFDLYYAHLRLQQIPEALAEINNAIKYGKQDGDLYVCRAEIYYHLNQLEDAFADIRQAKLLLSRPNATYKKIRKMICDALKQKRAAAREEKRATLAQAVKPEESELTSITYPAAELEKPSTLPETCPEKLSKKPPPSPNIYSELKKARRKEKHETKKAKRELNEKKHLHAEKIHLSKQIIQLLITNIFQAEDTQAQILDHQERHTAFFSAAQTTAKIAKRMQMHQSIMCPSNLLLLRSLHEHAATHHATLRIYGSSVLAFMLTHLNHASSIINTDIDYQIYADKGQKLSPDIQIEHEKKGFKFQYSSTSFLQMRSETNEKDLEATLVFDNKAYHQKYDPIDITRCGLIFKRDPDSLTKKFYLDFDETYPILENAFSKGFFTVDLSKNLAQASGIFARMIKYSNLLNGILKMRVILSSKDTLSDNIWDHSKWQDWVEQYFTGQFSRGQKGIETSLREIEHLMKFSYLRTPAIPPIAQAFCYQYLKKRAIYKDNHFTTSNMVNLLVYFYREYSDVPAATVCDEIINRLNSNSTFNKIYINIETTRRIAYSMSIKFKHDGTIRQQKPISHPR